MNSLWFLSLVVNLITALLATMSQQWARRYVAVTRPSGYSPEKQARIRAFFATGALSSLLHLSILVFFAGLLVFLFNIDSTVFRVAAGLIAYFLMIYGLFTVLPVLSPNSPYFTPSSQTIFFLYATIQHLLSGFTGILPHDIRERFDASQKKNRDRLLRRMGIAAQAASMDSSQETDLRIVESTLAVLGENDKLDQFFDAIPGFFSSYLVRDLTSHLSDDLGRRLQDTLGAFLCRTLSSNLVVESVKVCRLNMAMNSTHAIRNSKNISRMLYDILTST